MQALHRIVSVGLFTFALLGCARIGVASEVVYEGDALRVALETDPTATSEPSGQNDHPVSLDTAQLTMLLKGMEVERQPSLLKSLVSGPIREPAFDHLEVVALAPRLGSALARASPRERVSFLLIQSVSSQPGAETAGAVWIRNGGFHLVLHRHRSPPERQPVLPGPYESSFSRGRPSQRVRPDFALLFSPSSYVIKQEITPAALLFASPETEVVVDYRRLFADAGKAPEKTTATAVDARQGTTGLGVPDAVRSERSVPDLAERLTDAQTMVRTLTERVKVLETQVTDLLDIVKRLTGSVEEGRKALAAKESELRAKEEQIQSLLQGAPKTPKKPK